MKFRAVTLFAVIAFFAALECAVFVSDASAGGIQIPVGLQLPGLQNLGIEILMKQLTDSLDVGNAVTDKNPLEDKPPYQGDHFGLGGNNLIEGAIAGMKFSYEDMNSLLTFGFDIIAKYLGYKIKEEDKPFVQQAVKKIMAVDLDDNRAGKFTWAAENQIFECIDAFFAPRSRTYSTRTPIERRKIFNIISDGPIYPSGTPVVPRYANDIRPLVNFPAGHPYAGYSIYFSSKPRFMWFLRNAIRNNKESIEAGLRKDEAAMAVAGPLGNNMTPEKLAGVIEKLRTLNEMMKLIRGNTKSQKNVLKENYFESNDVAKNPKFSETKRENAGEMLGRLKSSGYSVPPESATQYNKIWQNLSVPGK